MGLRSQNNPIASYLDVFSKTGKDAVSPAPIPPPTGLTATGGVISDYTDGPAVYRAHIFTSSGTFDVTALGDFGDTVETFAIGGGGGGSGGFPGYGPGRGGGAGGAFVVTSYPVSVATYPISVGAGGVGAKTGPALAPYATGRGTAGGDSTFTNPSPQVLTAAGGGGGGDYDNPSAISPVSPGGPGGCGGGGGGYPGAPAPNIAGGTATQPSQNPGVANLTNYGFAGGTGDNTTGGGGGAGGGTGGVGDNYSAPTATFRSGGPGIPNVYAYGPGTPVTYGAGGPTGGPNTGPTVNATYSTGDGGMGWLTNPSPSKGGNGGSGIVVVRYQIAELTATAKATGGAISFSGGQTIHTFTSSGSFQVTSGPITCNWLVIGGGGSGGIGAGGGGGAGGYRTSMPEGPGGPSPSSEPTQTIANGTYTITVGAGGVGSDRAPSTAVGTPGGFSRMATPSPIRSEGGGGGAHTGGSAQVGENGGSGGGGDYPSLTVAVGNRVAGTTTPAPNQGYPGGTSALPANYGTGGGGGAGGQGGAGSPTAGGDGGLGKTSTISGSPVARAGGGGGAIYLPSTDVGTASAGGGYAAPNSGPAPRSGPTSIMGTENTGGGGGGGTRGDNAGPPVYPGSDGYAGNGGSGIVIIAYPS